VLSVADDLAPILYSRRLAVFEVYELETTDGTVLYYASQDVTWDGEDYEALAVEREVTEESMGFAVPSVGVTFSNVQNTLRAYLEPVDLLTGGRLTCRILFRDGSGTLLDDSLVLFSGRMERPERVGEEAFQVTATGLLDGFGVEIPRRKTGLTCPWRFADGIHCAYTFTTLANGAGSASTALTVDSGTNLRAGQEITIGGGTPVVLASGGGTSWTLAAARTWSDNAQVAYTQCNRELSDCTLRLQKHRFGGFPSAALVSRLHWILGGFGHNVPPASERDGRPGF